MNNIATKQVKSSRQTALNFVYGIAEHIISAGMALLLTPFLISRLGLETYGLYPIALEFAAFFGILFGIINSTSCRYIAIEDERGNLDTEQRYFSTAFFSNVALCAIALVPMSLTVIFANRLLSVPDNVATDLRVFLILVFAAVLIDALSSTFGSVYYINNRLDVRSAQQFVGAVTKALTLTLLFIFFKPSVISVGVAILLSSTVMALIQIPVCAKYRPQLKPSLSAFSITAARQLTASGLWYSFNRAAATLMCGAVLIVANIFLLPEVSGAYSLAFVVSNALGGIILTLAAILIPVSAKCFARGERKRLRDSLARDEKVIGFFAAAAVAVAIAFCGDFFTLWVGEKAAPLLISLTVTLLTPLPALACATPIINVAMVMNRTRRFSLLFLCGGLLALSCALASTAFFNTGAIGIAAVSCAAQLLWYSLATPIFAARVLEASPKFFLSPILKTYLATALSFVCCRLLASVCEIRHWGGLVIVCGAAAAVSGAVSFALIFKTPQKGS